MPEHTLQINTSCWCADGGRRLVARGRTTKNPFPPHVVPSDHMRLLDPLPLNRLFQNTGDELRFIHSSDFSLHGLQTT